MRTIEDFLNNSEEFNTITYEPLKELTLKLCREFYYRDSELANNNNIETLSNKSNMVCRLMFKMFEAMGQYFPNSTNSSTVWLDVLIASVYIHYFSFNEEYPITSLYILREYIETEKPLLDTIDKNVITSLCESLECATGPEIKVRKCAPVPNSPQQVFSDAIFYVNNFDIKLKDEENRDN